MRKFIALIGLISLLVSCKSKQEAVSTTVDRRSQVAIKGNWTLTNVAYAGSDYIKVTSFEVADAKCFEGSVWEFVSNNDTGKMTLTKSGCTMYSSDIKWYVTKEQQFVLKFLNEGAKARKVKEGYILTLTNQTMESFQLVDVVDIAGNKGKVTYTFRKNK